MFTRLLERLVATSEFEFDAPGYWHVTLICLTAGAFCETIYDVAARRVDEISNTGDEGDEKNPPKDNEGKPEEG